MSITIVPYIDQTNTDYASMEAAKTSSDKPLAFGETLEQAKKAQNLLAADAAIAQAKNQGLGGVDLNSKQASALGLYQVVTASNLTGAPKVVAASSTQTNAQGNLECSQELQELFEEAAATYGVDINLLKSVGKVESNFDANAKSKAGAMGVMQLMPTTAQSYGVTDAMDPRQNIMAGAQLLSELLDKYDGDTTLALASYNAGSTAVARAGGVPSSARAYVNKVLGYYTVA